jgi:hypothetical protein
VRALLRLCLKVTHEGCERNISPEQDVPGWWRMSWRGTSIIGVRTLSLMLALYRYSTTFHRRLRVLTSHASLPNVIILQCITVTSPHFENLHLRCYKLDVVARYRTRSHLYHYRPFVLQCYVCDTPIIAGIAPQHFRSSFSKKKIGRCFVVLQPENTLLMQLSKMTPNVIDTGENTLPNTASQRALRVTELL